MKAVLWLSNIWPAHWNLGTTLVFYQRKRIHCSSTLCMYEHVGNEGKRERRTEISVGCIHGGYTSAMKNGGVITRRRTLDYKSKPHNAQLIAEGERENEQWARRSRGAMERLSYCNRVWLEPPMGLITVSQVCQGSKLTPAPHKTNNGP